MDDNPYQSSSVPSDQGDPFGPTYPLVAITYRSEELMRRACKSYMMESPILTLAAIGAAVMFVVLMVVFQAQFESMPVPLGVLAFFVWIGLFWTLCARLRERRTIRSIKSHPILSALALKVELTADSLVVSAGTDQATWPLKQVLSRGSNREFLVLEVRSCLIVVVPHDALFTDPEPFDAFSRAVKRRLRRQFWSQFWLAR